MSPAISACTSVGREGIDTCSGRIPSAVKNPWSIAAKPAQNCVEAPRPGFPNTTLAGEPDAGAPPGVVAVWPARGFGAVGAGDGVAGALQAITVSSTMRPASARGQRVAAAMLHLSPCASEEYLGISHLVRVASRRQHEPIIVASLLRVNSASQAPIP